MSNSPAPAHPNFPDNAAGRIRRFLTARAEDAANRGSLSVYSATIAVAGSQPPVLLKEQDLEALLQTIELLRRVVQQTSGPGPAPDPAPERLPQDDV